MQAERARNIPGAVCTQALGNALGHRRNGCRSGESGDTTTTTAFSAVDLH